MKDVSGYEGIYAVTKDGRVWSYPKDGKHAGKWIKGFLSGTRSVYYQVTLCNRGSESAKLVHRLVIETWGPPQPSGMNLVNHINGNKLDNRLENLEWASHSTDATHAYKLGLRTPVRGEAHGHSKLTVRQVVEMRAGWPDNGSLSQLAEKYKIDKMSVWRIINRKSWKHI